MKPIKHENSDLVIEVKDQRQKKMTKVSGLLFSPIYLTKGNMRKIKCINV